MVERNDTAIASTLPVVVLPPSSWLSIWEILSTECFLGEVHKIERRSSDFWCFKGSNQSVQALQLLHRGALVLTASGPPPEFGLSGPTSLATPPFVSCSAE